MIVKSCKYNSTQCYNESTEYNNIILTQNGEGIVVVTNISLPSMSLFSMTVFIQYMYEGASQNISSETFKTSN